jgi:hypothetical protein
MSSESSERALLALVDAYRSRECAALLDKARAEAAVELRQAHGKARASMRRGFAEARERRAARIAAARAELATRERLAEQQRLLTLLDEAWPLLADELTARWAEPESRSRWVAHAVERARSLLPPGPWRITYAPGWPEAERSSLAASLAVAPAFVTDSSHRAGLSIASLASVIDATLEGLLADRAEIGAQLLVELRRRPVREGAVP